MMTGLWGIFFSIFIFFCLVPTIHLEQKKDDKISSAKYWFMINKWLLMNNANAFFSPTLDSNHALYYYSIIGINMRKRWVNNEFFPSNH